MFEGKLSGLRQFLATEIPSKILKYAFYSTLKALSFSRYLNIFPLFSHARKTA